jgi:hypothetical protein
MIKVITGSVHITEDTLRSLLKAVEVARQSIPFLKDPDVGLPGSDMSDDELIRQRSIRGNILVRSCCIECEDFWINIELPGKVRGESAGYELCYPERLEDEDIEKARNESASYRWYYPEDIEKGSS